MKRLFREIIGYALGGILFVVLLPLLMWFVSGQPAIWSACIVRIVFAAIISFAGLTFSIWTIVYMRHKGDGNPMDAFGHEVAPRTQHLMTDGPYRLNRNPMLTGTLVFHTGVCVLLWTWQAMVVLALFFAIMMIQVASEEKRLHREFGKEYEDYCRQTRRF